MEDPVWDKSAHSGEVLDFSIKERGRKKRNGPSFNGAGSRSRNPENADNGER